MSRLRERMPKNISYSVSGRLNYKLLNTDFVISVFDGEHTGLSGMQFILLNINEGDTVWLDNLKDTLAFMGADRLKLFAFDITSRGAGLVFDEEGLIIEPEGTPFATQANSLNYLFTRIALLTN